MAVEAERVPDPQDVPTLSVEQAARFLNISRNAAYAAARTGELPTIRIGRSIRVPTAAFRRLLLLDE